MKIVEGSFNKGNEKLKICVLLSRFNSFITERLLEGCVDTLIRHGIKDENITVFKVPGAFEIPETLNTIIKYQEKEFDGVITLGAVIRGSTPHFDYIANEVSKGIANISLNSKIPITFGVITTDTIEQAIERAGTKSGNKGSDSAYSLLELINLYRKIKGE